MRFTRVLFSQHLGWHTKMKWRLQKRRVIWNDNSVDHLKEIGLPVIDPIQEFMKKPIVTLVKQFLFMYFITTKCYFFKEFHMLIQLESQMKRKVTSKHIQTGMIASAMYSRTPMC